MQITNDANGPSLSLTGSSYPGRDDGQLGVVFTADAMTPADNPGAFIWVQLVDGDQRKELDANGSFDCPSQPEHGLDKAYPYASGTRYTNDSPHIPLAPSGDAEFRRTFKATMFLMWDPSLPSGCSTATQEHESTCSSIPVPLGSGSWSYSGCAINTLENQKNGTSWMLHCGQAKALLAQSSVFPEWKGVAESGEGLACKTHQY